MLAPITHILPLTTIRRERLLPVLGKVVVRKGQKVSATDTIAEANLAPSHLLLDVARGLGLPPEKADDLIQVDANSQIVEDDIIAGPVGLTRRVVRSPQSGRVILAGSGQVLIEVNSKPFELKAGLPGVVAELFPEKGALIETTGALIQGVWGNNKIDFGLMNDLAKEPDHEFTSDQMDVSFRGSMILAGHVEQAEALKAAADLPVRGLILASINPDLIPLAADLKIPVIILEGFGRRPFSSVAFKLLSTNEQREIALNAEPWDRYKGTRPEIVIPLPASGQPDPPTETDVFKPEQQVRIQKAPHLGQIGSLVALLGAAEFPGGLRAPAAEVRLDDGETAVLPLANLEVLA
jgi:hypothetical protein